MTPPGGRDPYVARGIAPGAGLDRRARCQFAGRAAPEYPPAPRRRPGA